MFPKPRVVDLPVIFDIGDNIFEGKKRIDKQARLARLREVLSLSTHIVYSTPVLAAQLECYTSGLPISKWVIPDQIDMPQTGTAAYLNPGQRYELSRLRAFVPAKSEERRVGKEWVTKCRSRWSPCHKKKNNT